MRNVNDSSIDIEDCTIFVSARKAPIGTRGSAAFGQFFFLLTLAVLSLSLCLPRARKRASGMQSIAANRCPTRLAENCEESISRCHYVDIKIFKNPPSRITRAALPTSAYVVQTVWIFSTSSEHWNAAWAVYNEK